MPRRARVTRRVILPDPIYANVGLAKFVNCMMLKGKKSIAEGIVYDAFEKIRRSSRKEPLDVFDQAIRNVTPVIEVKPKRVGGATYQVPVEIRHDRRQALEHLAKCSCFDVIQSGNEAAEPLRVFKDCRYDAATAK